ncbi:MAG: hypothetical protein WD473_11970 [Acidimicrobiia bacterium]
MRMTQRVVDQIVDAYKRMAKEARYRSEAPSDGCGNITAPLEDLDIDAEAVRYVRWWWKTEDRQLYDLGCPCGSDRPALIFIVEAARNLNGMAPKKLVATLLRMALAEVEAGK